MYNSSIANNTTSKVVKVDFVAASRSRLTAQKQSPIAFDKSCLFNPTNANLKQTNAGWFEVEMSEANLRCVSLLVNTLSIPSMYLHEPLQCEATHSQPTWDSRQSQGDYSALEPCVDWEAYGKVIA